MEEDEQEERGEREKRKREIKGKKRGRYYNDDDKENVEQKVETRIGKEREGRKELEWSKGERE